MSSSTVSSATVARLRTALRSNHSAAQWRRLLADAAEELEAADLLAQAQHERADAQQHLAESWEGHIRALLLAMQEELPYEVNQSPKTSAAWWALMQFIETLPERTEQP